MGASSWLHGRGHRLSGYPPLGLGSLWAFIPAGLTIMLLIVRTVFEDRTLQAELVGYQDYMQQTRYRLIPGFW